MNNSKAHHTSTALRKNWMTMITTSNLRTHLGTKLPIRVHSWKFNRLETSPHPLLCIRLTKMCQKKDQSTKSATSPKRLRCNTLLLSLAVETINWSKNWEHQDKTLNKWKVFILKPSKLMRTTSTSFTNNARLELTIPLQTIRQKTTDDDKRPRLAHHRTTWIDWSEESKLRSQSWMLASNPYLNID